VTDQVIPVFSGGVGRSGTTIVGRILRRHPELFAGAPNEIKFITETYGLIDLAFGMRDFMPSQMTNVGKLAKLNPFNASQKFRYRQFRKRSLSHWWRRTNRLGVESGLHRSMKRTSMIELLDKLESDLESDSRQAVREFVFGFVKNHKKFEGQKFWMDTTPPNMMYADWIYKLFPEARFIEMRRNPLDNLSSVLKEPWGPSDFEESLPWIRDRLFLATKAKKNIPADQHLTLWLEDLVLHNRDASYRDLISIVGIGDHDAMREYFDTEVSADRAHIGRWQKDFKNPERVRRMFEEIVGPIERGQ
jgi:hypothetical protein